MKSDREMRGGGEGAVNPVSQSSFTPRSHSNFFSFGSLAPCKFKLTFPHEQLGATNSHFSPRSMFF